MMPRPMFVALRTATLARAAAALLALALSGAPRAAVSLAPEKPHRCQCRHGAGERCTCPVCGQRARRAQHAALAELPPCHRAVAAEALAAEDEHERRHREVPCLQGDCGATDPAAPPRASTETFTLPDPPLLGPAGSGPPVPAPAARRGVGAPAPEPPPPRAA
jgi:hypothetical protein